MVETIFVNLLDSYFLWQYFGSDKIVFFLSDITCQTDLQFRADKQDVWNAPLLKPANPPYDHHPEACPTKRQPRPR